ncbi:Agaricus bisporus lectin [Fusarium sp. NRRL 25303]|uniref:Related to Agaricus bisporus lectin n=1 Tax=Fusarium mangiferae TaxID=192010 RepID=A0A1L7U5Y1_FUSMA|nr:uncharacterized protein FMAN_03919 [Fusarium mangiferae]KAF5653516.1 Agaricus bisporus lectin [Fusarium sp. NRRL 25303]CVL06094.1 related to Agaricus bisporus lectin [Fusarium mangiferae]
MPYTVKVRVYQTNQNAYFRVVETVCWHYTNCEWNESNGVLSLYMGDSGNGGLLRFKNEEGKEAFSVAIGVHVYKPWLDIITGLADNITGAQSLPEYYGETTDKTKRREATKTEQSVLNIDHRNITAKYRVKEGENLELDIIIG